MNESNTNKENNVVKESPIMKDNNTSKEGGMMKENKRNMTLSIIIFIIAVVVIAFIIINKKTNAPTGLESGEINKDGESLGDGISMENKTTKSTAPVKNLTTTILKEGSGQAAKSGDTVIVNYTGRLANGTVFDSNVDPKFGHVEPFAFTLGVGQVIKGWDEGVVGMKIGEKRNLLIAPAYGYGARGAGAAIPPNATLSFDVELVEIKK